MSNRILQHTITADSGVIACEIYSCHFAEILRKQISTTMRSEIFPTPLNASMSKTAASVEVGSHQMGTGIGRVENNVIYSSVQRSDI